MALKLAKLGRSLYERGQSVSQNLTKEKIKNELGWMSLNMAVGAAAKTLTSATLAAVTPAATVTLGGLAAAAFVTSSIRHIADNAKAEYNDAVKKGEIPASKLRLLWKHANEDDLIPHIKTGQFWGRTVVGLGFSAGMLWGLENTTVGQNVAEHTGRAFQKTTHWLSDRANAVFSKLRDAVQLDAKSVLPIQPSAASPVATAAPLAAAPAPNMTADLPAASPPSDAAPVALPPTKMNVSKLIAAKHLETPQAIKDYAYNLLNGKNGVTADPEAAIALYKHVAPINPQARLDLEYLASQKKYEGFGLKDYLKSNPALATHTPATGIAAAKPLAPTLAAPAPVPASVPVADPHDLSAYFPHETTEPPSATRVVMECTTGLTPDNIQHIDSTKPLEPVCNVLTNYAFAGDRLVIDGQEMYKAPGPRTFTLEWAGRLVEEFTARKAAFLRAAAEKFAAVAAPSPAPVTLAAAPIPTGLAPQ